jgi:hypothetical protein
MRSDLKKVICEDARRGPRDSGYPKGWKKSHRSRNPEDREDYGEMEFEPRHESFTKRFLWDEKRRFSENLGALRGLIHKNLGRSWDRFYSELCQQVSPTGTTIEKHVHQHLGDFIDIKTRMNGSQLEVCGYSGKWEPAGQGWARTEYYVHPSSRRICRYRRKPKAQQDWQAVRAARILAVRRPTDDPTIEIHRINGTWYHVYLEPGEPSIYEDLLVRRYSIIGQLCQSWDAEQVLYGSDGGGFGRPIEAHEVLCAGKGWRAYRKQALNHRELKRLKLENVQKEPS